MTEKTLGTSGSLTIGISKYFDTYCVSFIHTQYAVNTKEVKSYTFMSLHILYFCQTVLLLS